MERFRLLIEINAEEGTTEDCCYSHSRQEDQSHKSDSLHNPTVVAHHVVVRLADEVKRQTDDVCHSFVEALKSELG